MKWNSRFLDLSAISAIRFFITHCCFVIYYFGYRFWVESLPLYMHVTKYKGCKKNKKAFVFANGPSLAKLDPHKIAKLSESGEFDVIGINSYISSPFGTIAKPTLYVLSDPGHFGCSGLETANKQGGEDFSLLQERCPGITLFIPHQFRSVLGTVFNVIPFCDRETAFSPNCTDIRWPRNFFPMTAYKALQIACYLGYKKIYIAGFDNDYFKTVVVDKANQIWNVDAHFYDGKGLKRKVDAAGGYCSRNMAEYLIVMATLFRHLYRFPSDKISNLICDSLVDAFPKTDSLDVYTD